MCAADHMVIGYDAGYYGYLYSEVLAYAILDEFKKAAKSESASASALAAASATSTSGGGVGGGGSGDGCDGGDARPTFESLGRRYRRCILEPCASKDGAQMLRDFLGGREPSPDAFLDALGISEPPPTHTNPNVSM
jgi:Zn-dependent oligopeptidase